MTRYDFSPLFRSTVGFDRLMKLAETAMSADDQNGYPPYNIEKTDENAYRITMAVAGFGEDDLDIEAHENTLTVTGRTSQEGDERQFLYRGIAGRSFKRQFQLADHVKVKGADLVDGLLHIDLVREIPEEMKPRKIEIAGGRTVDAKRIEGEKKAA